MSKYEDSVKKFKKWNEEVHLMHEKNKNVIIDAVTKKYSDKLTSNEIKFLSNAILFVTMFSSDTRVGNHDVEKLNQILEKIQ